LIVTTVAAIVFETRKLVLSASRTDPLFVSWIILNWSLSKTKGFRGLPAAAGGRFHPGGHTFAHGYHRGYYGGSYYGGACAANPVPLLHLVTPYWCG
jgi:uncharacterized membrane protein